MSTSTTSTTSTALGTGLAPDPALPHRDALLDPEAAGRRLRALLCGSATAPAPVAGAARGPATTRRVRYGPGRSLRVVQALLCAGPGLEGLVISTRGVPADRWEQVAEAAGAARSVDGVADGPTDGTSARAATPRDPVTGLPAVVTDRATSSVSWVFPHDRRLATLPDVWLRRGATRTVLGPRWTRTRLMALSPEKSATLRCLDGDGGTLAYVKVYADATAARDAADRADLATLAGRPHDRLAPAVLALVPEACALVLAPIDGRPVADLPAAALPDALAGLGATLARLHAQPAGRLPPLARFTPTGIAAAAADATVGRPDLADAVAGICAALAAVDPHDPAAPPLLVPVHGDPSLGNALATPSGIVLVDFDEAAAGHPAADLAAVLAGLRRRCLLGALAADHADVLAARFLAAYAAHAGSPDDGALRWHVAAALLVQGAARAVRRVQPAGLARMPALLDDALGLATGHLDLARSPTGDPWRTP